MRLHWTTLKLMRLYWNTGETTLDETALDDIALDDTSLGEIALYKTALDDIAPDKTALDEAALHWMNLGWTRLQRIKAGTYQAAGRLATHKPVCSCVSGLYMLTLPCLQDVSCLPGLRICRRRHVYRVSRVCLACE